VDASERLPAPPRAAIAALVLLLTAILGSFLVRDRAFATEGADGPSIPDGSPASAPYIIDDPYAGPGRFRKGELHTHSNFSFDGWSSVHPGDLAQAYKRRGYEFVAITDHDVISYPRELNSDSFIVLPAYESTSDSGHITALFSNRVVLPDAPAQERLDFIRNDGGMAILNHPTWQVGWSGTDLRTLQGCFAIELYNGLTSSDARAARAITMWHDLLNSRGQARRLWAVATDDAHDVNAIDRGWVMAKTAALTEDAIRAALQSGAFYASTGPSFAQLGVVNGAISASSPDDVVIRFIDQDMNVVYQGPSQGSAYFPRAGDRWIRIEAATAEGKTAWSQPFWIVSSTEGEPTRPPPAP
jgi:PHP domain